MIAPHDAIRVISTMLIYLHLLLPFPSRESSRTSIRGPRRRPFIFPIRVRVNTAEMHWEGKARTPECINPANGETPPHCIILAHVILTRV